MARMDVTVRGAGVFGLAVAWACARRGARVQVIDPAGVAAGASGGVVGALAPHVPEQWNEKKAFQLESLLMAEAFWADVAEVGGGDPGYARLGRVQPLADEAAVQLARARAEEASALWQGHATWEVVPASGNGWEPPSPSGWLVRDSLSARVHPRRATKALAAAVLARGGQVLTEGADAGAVVWATGWAGLAERGLGNGVKGQAAVLALDRRDAPQLFVGGVHVVPHSDGTVAVGATSERDWDDATTTDDRLDVLLTQVRAALPALGDVTVLARWAGVRPRAASRAPLLGQLADGSFIANGGFKIGFGMAPLVGEVMADLLLEGRDRIPEDFRLPGQGRGFG
ncbi:MAG: FAD-dependent oxidoreductase [Limimaricola sp.]|uniref:NAD(P)/FAD-dependent oxidoreductase n=1 Tax=Limimaricola sp. TaxID=2211665 RepID=UPI001D448C8B|nr:FAD-binding oxidoreductase [Limimaricola sp.]MBI1418699.1 FAD-dependent oxidoreductase [Limimaricola sp.]